MTAFGEQMRSLMAERGISLRRLAKTVNYDVGYLSKVSNGIKPPSPALAAGLDRALEANGRLAALAPPRGAHGTPARQPADPVHDGSRLAAAVQSIRDDLREDAKLLHARACQLASAADPLHAALCRGQAIACENAAEHLTAALSQGQPDQPGQPDPATPPPASSTDGPPAGTRHSILP